MLVWLDDLGKPGLGRLLGRGFYVAGFNHLIEGLLLLLEAGHVVVHQLQLSHLVVLVHQSDVLVLLLRRQVPPLG